MVIYRKKIREGTVQGKSRDWSEDTKVRLRIWEKWKRIILLGTFFVLAIGIPWEIRAENAAVTFGSNYYTATDNETFPIGVYLNGDSKIGTYEVKISYDNRRLEYTGGGDSEENGVITLSGTGVNAQVKYMLKFQTRSAPLFCSYILLFIITRNQYTYFFHTLYSSYCINSIPLPSGSSQKQHFLFPMV